MSESNSFVLVFNRQTDRLEQILEFGTDSAAALDAYSATEREYWNRPHMDVVMLGGESLDTIRITHPNYFESAHEHVAALLDSIANGKLRASA